MAEESFGPYRLGELIGRGGMGEVHRAFDTVKQRTVAIKRLPARLTADPEFERRFRAEARLAARLQEPHIIPIHDYGEIDGRLYIDMRLVEGQDLASMLVTEGSLAVDRVVGIIAQVAAALDAAHAQDLAHRDIKPSNILITPGGPGHDEFVYVADFGIARVLSSGTTSLTATGATVGSLEYMAPERFTAGHGDHRVDVYSLGCLLFEALTGRKPFEVEGLPAIINAHLNTPPPKPSELVEGLPPGLDAVVARAMAKDPDDRYRSAGELADTVRAAAAGKPIPAAPPTAAAIPPTVLASAPPTAASVGGVPVPATSVAASPAPAGPPSGASPPPTSGARRRLAAVSAGVLTLLVLGVSMLVLSNAQAAEITREPVLTPGDNPFMPPAGTDRPGVAPPPSTGRSFPGDTPGLYGGTLNNAACDKDQMIRFLAANPDKQAAWAQVQGIPTLEVSGYIAGLTPAVLRSDTAVTNHGFADGRPTPRAAILQAGTAVLIDDHGVPRARCYCGNPLTPPADSDKPGYTDDSWSSFSPASITTVVASSTPVNRFTMTDLTTDQPFYRAPGSSGADDQPVGTLTETTAPPPPTTERPPPPPPTTTQPPPPTTEQPVPSAPAQQSLADLAPSTITFDRSAAAVGQRIHFDSGVRNLGDTGTGAFNIKWLVDGREVGAYGSHDGVSPRATVMNGNSQFDWTFERAGRHRVTFLVDADSFVNDADRANNSTTVTVEVEQGADHSPRITGTSTYREGVMIYARVNFVDEDDDAAGFGFRGVNGAGWAPEQHPFSSPSYGRVADNRVDYPFNHACGQSNQYESDVQFHIYDSRGNKSNNATVHLSCD